MSSRFLSSVVRTLRFSAIEPEDLRVTGREERTLFHCSAREWSRHFGTLDRVGLTLPLYARLLQDGWDKVLPSQVIAALEKRRNDNDRRMVGMLLTFGNAVKALQEANVGFVCVKGFSLIPDYLDEMWQRHQIDFDFLVRPEDGQRAHEALRSLGYELTAVDGDERRLRIPVSRPLARNAYLYDPQEGAAIELHSMFWESGAEALHLRCPTDAIEQAEMHTVGPVVFLRLSRHHAFLYQILHVFRHFLGAWARLLWLYEIAAYMHRYRDDDALWQKVQALLSTDARLSEAGALVLLSAQELFACPIPSALKSMCTLPAKSPVQFWVTHYANRWLLTDMPGNKLNLLLQRHLFSDSHAWRNYLTSRLVPLGKRPRLSEGIKRNAANSIALRAANLRYKMFRIWHHLSSGVGFAFASVAWRLHYRSSHRGLSSTDLRRGES